MIVFIARSSNSFLALLFSLFAGKLLTVEDHGLYGQSMARMIVVQALTEVGLQYSLVRFMSPAIQNGDLTLVRILTKASVFLKFLAIVSTGGVAALLIALVPFQNMSFLIPGGNPDSMLLVWMIFLGGAGMSMVSYFDAILVAHQSYIRLSLWLPTTGLIRLLLLGLLALNESHGIRGEHVIFSFALAPFFSLAAYFVVFPVRFFSSALRVSGYGEWSSRLFTYNLWILAASFCSILSDWMEILLISNERDSGLFNAARMPMQGFLILLATMQSILLPRFSGLTKREDYFALFQRIYRFTLPLAVLLFPGVFLFAWFIPAWYGAEYLPSVHVLYLLYPNFLFRLFFAPLGTALFALDQPRIIAIEAGLRMVSGVILNLLLIPRYGIVGAALASLLAQGSGWIFLIYCYSLYFRSERFPLGPPIR